MAEIVNPFASPLSSEHALRTQCEGDWADQRGRGPIVMLFIGGLLGGAVAAVAGAAGAAALGLSVGFFGRETHDRIGLVIIGPFLGAFSGGFTGIPCGASLGLVAGFCKARASRWLVISAISLSALIGLSVGALGGLMLTDVPIRQPALLTVTAGILCGGAAGALGGWLLARLLAAACWGRAPTP